jgi:hypothetical protein
VKEASYRQLYQRQVQATYSEWTETLRLLKQVTDPQVKQMWLEDLAVTYDRAKQLMTNVSVNPASEPHLKLILSRPLEQWVTLVKHSGAVVM